MDALELIKEKFKNDNFAQSLGIILDELTKNTINMHMKLRPEMNNFNGRPHGGIIYGLADAAFSVIGNNQNNVCVALDCTINYHASPNTGQILHVEGKLIKQSRRIGTYLFSIYTKVNQQRLEVATMLSTLYCTGESHDMNLK